MSKEKKSDKKQRTRVFIETYKGNKTFSIWPVDKKGEKTSAIPIVGVGYKKVLALNEHKDKFDRFIKECEGEASEESSAEESSEESSSDNRSSKSSKKKRKSKSEESSN